MSRRICTKKNRVCETRGSCGALSDDKYTCTRQKEHKGAHVACGNFGHNYKIWENEKDV
jgi:hypothetical protein